VRRGELTAAEAEDILRQVTLLPVTRHFDAALLMAAFDLAVQTGRTVYDSCYLALAVRLNGQMASADEHFVKGLAGTPWAAAVIRIQDV
jgi:predicted nucleic acid-binding protein